jgi:ACS family hexuronate transporter-like MFS transporter
MSQSQPEAPASPTSSGVAKPASNFRWVILGLLFFATTINYLDRNVMGILAKDLKELFLISDSQYGDIQSAFALAYACGQLVCGRLLDIIGVRAGFALALVLWCVASMSHALAGSAFGFKLARIFLGVAESPNFPASTKTISEWFPRKERAFAFGFVNAGTNMGALAAPAIVPWLYKHYGWQGAFVATGLVGLIWLALWLPLYRSPAQHPRVSKSELALIESDPPEPTEKVPWRNLVGNRRAMAFATAKFLTDSMWWFYITWFPLFLSTQHHLKVMDIGWPLIVIYLMADVGSVAGGWFSSSLIKRGASVNHARKSALLVCSVAMFPVFFAQNIEGLWPAVFVMGIATAAHQGFSSNLYTLVSDMFPRQSVASVAGFGGTAGYLGASLFQLAVGRMIESTGKYYLPFICAASAYIIAFALIHLLVPVIKPPTQNPA